MVHPQAILFGILLAGGIASPANPMYTATELAHQIKDSTAKFVVTLSPFAENAVKAATGANIALDHVYVLGPSNPSGTQPFTKLLENDGASIRPSSQHPNDVIVIPYSSGTTGLPKGVMLTHSNLVANILQVKCVNGTSVTAADSFLGVLPFFHIFGLVVTLFVGMWLGNTVVVLPKFELEPFLKTLQDHKVTTLQLVPPIILALAKHPLVAKYDLSAVRIIMSGAAPLGPDTTKALTKRLPHIALRQGYGMTELSPVSHFQTHDDIIPGSIGMLLCNQEAMIVDPDTLQSQPVGKTGELWIRGPNVMKGYWRRPDATASTIVEGGWLRTGDIATVTENNHWYIVDRLKELIKFKGFQVPPAELEEALLNHPDVADVAVLGIPDERAGELPKAYIVLKPGAKTTEEDIHKFAKTKLAPHKQLRGGVQFTDTIPKSAAGKILRRILKDQDAKVRAAAQGKAKL